VARERSRLLGRHTAAVLPGIDLDTSLHVGSVRCRRPRQDLDSLHAVHADNHAGTPGGEGRKALERHVIQHRPRHEEVVRNRRKHLGLPRRRHCEPHGSQFELSPAECRAFVGLRVGPHLPVDLACEVSEFRQIMFHHVDIDEHGRGGEVV